ncbi:MAG: hypothetical protein AAFO06_25775 [Cyanobacteria bacterium J06597_16]
MRYKHLSLLALTVCTVIVIGAGLAKAVLMPGTSQVSPEVPSVVAQALPNEQEISPEVTAVTEATLTHLQQGSSNSPQSPTVRRAVIEEDYALATWSWGEAGGQTVLSRTDETWTVLTGGGGAIDVAGLEAAGVPTAIAEELIERDRTAWEQEDRP